MHVHLHVHAAYDTDANSVFITANVRGHEDPAATLLDPHTILWEKRVELMWEDHKDIGIRSVIDRAVAAFISRCRLYGEPF